MHTQPLGRVFLNAGVMATLCLALAAVNGYLLLQAHGAARAPGLPPMAMYHLGLIALAFAGVIVVLVRLFRVVRAAVRHDVHSLTRMFRDVREGELRESYPIALREFAETLSYLRASGRRLMLERQRLRYLGLIDHLSQLSNRRHFERRLQQLFEARKSKGGSTVVLIDLDHFKAVNDQHGHDCGDALIVKFSQALRACVRQTDFLARLGGDEFCIIYPYTPIERAQAYVQRLRQQLPRELRLMNGVTHALRWTGGMSAMSDADTRFDNVLWRADKALIQAKEAGRNNTKVYDPAHREQPVRRVVAS